MAYLGAPGNPKSGLPEAPRSPIVRHKKGPLSRQSGIT